MNNNFLFDWNNNIFNSSSTFIRSDIYETDYDYRIEIELPGIKKEDLKIEYINGYININAKKVNTITNENDKILQKERYYGELGRSFYVGDIQESNIKTEFENGLLKIVINKNNATRGNVKELNID